MKAAISRQKPLILIVDDELFMRRTLRAALDEAGFVTEEVQNGIEALPAFEQLQPDLVLLDLVMPEMDGYATCKALRKLPGGEHVPILVVTGLEDTDSIHQAFEVGATDFITKPIKNELLVYRINYMLRASRTMGDLIESEARLANAQRIADLGHWNWDVKTKNLWCSDETYRIFGLPHLDFDNTYKSFLSVVHPDDQDMVNAHFQRGLKEKTPYDIEHRIARIDGTLRNVHVQGESSVDTSGNLVRMFGTIQDITNRKQSEEKLIILKEAVECLPIGITVTDISGRIFFTNPAEAEIHGYTQEELLQREARDLAPAHLRKPIPLEEFQNLGLWKRESTNLRKNDEEFPVQLTSIPVRNGAGKYLGFVTACEDITERKNAEKEIEQLAYYDVLTNLPNRGMFQKSLQQALSLASRQKWQVAVLFLDLDRFKDVNDTLGHEFGDKLLQAVAQRLDQCVRKEETVARLGGDEFVVVLSSLTDQSEVVPTARRILESFSKPFDLDGRQIYSSTSIGIALYPTDGKDVNELLKNADAAMYHAKSQGRQTYRFFSKEVNQRIVERVSLESDLRRALNQEELILHYQPQIELATDRVVGVEALVRWQSPERGLLMPDQFVPLAEDTGLIYRLGEWVLRTACAQVSAWQEEGLESFRVAINISGHQFKQPGFLNLIDRVLEETGLQPACLELELTESVVMDRAEQTITTLRALKARGIHLSVDDFGTGYSSLSYLKHFPIDRIKIDRSFVCDVTTNPDDKTIIKAIIAMGHSLNLKVLAEGVETVEQLHLLKSLQCDEAQGYYFAKPQAEKTFKGTKNQNLLPVNFLIDGL